MIKVYENLIMVFFVLAIVLLVSAVGNIELDYWKTGIICGVFGFLSMILCLVCQHKQYQMSMKKYQMTYNYYMKNTK
jgi:cell division protein FtsW (lipid II flippase)